MSKRALEPSEERRAAPGVRDKTQEDEGMGEFEDAFEDEIESDEGEVVDAGGDMDVEGEQEDEEEDEEEEPAREAYMPGSAPLPEGHTLVPDQSAYDMLHRLNVTWPCLSFDFLRDNLGSQRQSFPHTAYLVAGTQADVAKNNEVLVMKASSMHRTSRDDGMYTRRARAEPCRDGLRHLA